MKIVYRIDIVPKVEQIIDLYNHSDYFPIKEVDDIVRIKKMHDNANIVATAWQTETLVGLARSICDFCLLLFIGPLRQGCPQGQRYRTRTGKAHERNCR
jgi:hypothetical protein